MPCVNCGEDTLIEYDSSAGNSICTACGTVLEENAIVSEITFGETSGGAAMVQGSYVGADQVRARAPAGYRKGGQESREQTMMNGRRRIQQLANALRLPERLSDAGTRYFNLAVNMNFVQGRRTQYVVAACLYTACRMDKTSHMLIDFSDLLEINVFVLGSTYLKLIKELNLHTPTIDPSLYISRFAALLEFGEETQKVAQDATRLVQRMGRDWMHIGRRPAGICAACLLLAARMNNFRRSVTEIVQVVKIADVTLRKRLEEFKETASGALTVSDFRTLWLEEAADPPAFAQRQKKDSAKSKKGKGKAKEKGEEGDGEDNEEEEDDMSDLDESVVGDEGGQKEFAELAARGSSPGPATLGKRRRKGDEEEEEEEEESDEEEEEEDTGPNPILTDNAELDDMIQAEMGKTLESEAGKQITAEMDKKLQAHMIMTASMTNLNTSDRLDDLDEDELDEFILNDEEVEAKSRLWMEYNREYLQNLADKQTGPDGELRPETKRRVRKRNRPLDSQNAPSTNAAEATKQMLTKKRFSKKINYAAIDGLFGNAKDDDDDGTDEPLLGRSHGRSGTPVARGKAILIPNPTFSGSSRAGTPARSRMSSEVPTPSTTNRVGAVSGPPVVEEDEADPEEEEEEEEEEQAPEEDDWRKAMGAGGDDDEHFGDYDEEL
ncbi:BRF1-domain-containing protein [Meredithblackwellia eburnea MCA 4105]